MCSFIQLLTFNTEINTNKIKNSIQLTHKNNII